VRSLDGLIGRIAVERFKLVQREKMSALKISSIQYSAFNSQMSSESNRMRGNIRWRPKADQNKMVSNDGGKETKNRRI
jgi:hypothetical protein